MRKNNLFADIVKKSRCSVRLFVFANSQGFRVLKKTLVLADVFGQCQPPLALCGHIKKTF